jgi:cyclic-di-AMP phosphodiesterase PgpH
MDFPPENIKDRVADFLTGETMRESVAIKILIGAILLIAGIFFFPHPEQVEYNTNVGTMWVDKDVVAQFSFPVYKDLRQYERERQDAIRKVNPVFERHDEMIAISYDSAKVIQKLLKTAIENRARFLGTRSASDSVAFIQSLKRVPFSLTDNEVKLIEKSAEQMKKGNATFLVSADKIISGYLNDVSNVGVIDQAKSKYVHGVIALRSGAIEDLLPIDKFYDQEEAVTLIASGFDASISNSTERGLLLKIARAALLSNILFNKEATDQEIQSVADNVPRTIGFVQQNDRIIGKHEEITDEIKLKLDSYRRSKIERAPVTYNWRYWVGTGLHVAIILGLFVIYLYLFRKKIFSDNGKITIIAAIIALEMFFAYLSLQLDLQVPLQYLVVVPMASMLLAIIFDSRVAFYGTVAIAFLIAGMRSNDYTIAFSSIIAGSFGAYTVRDIGSRTQIFRSLIYVFLGYFVSILALSFEQLESFSTILTQLGFALANAVFSSVLAYGFLIIFEKGFNVATDLTLAELSDLNHPLLVELSEKAPGTFHHSVTIATLAEAAAETVGANALLARVGGYYHDIGKILKPEYFVENQMGPHSRHTRLKPRMSALIISAHVREGIELARERGLPEKVIDFIPQHHGTTRISFFYDKALKQAARKPSKDMIVEDDFLYPGPKPQTKETGILMLADSVEAVTRSLTEVTPQKLETAISNMIKHRFMDGQLDECDLTLRDLRKIEEAFHKILMGMYHQRIKYPDQEAEIPPAAETTTPPPAAQPAEIVLPLPDSGKSAPEITAQISPQHSPVEPGVPEQQENPPQQHESSGTVE